MVLTIPLFAGIGACIGLMGGVLGGIDSDRWATLSEAHRTNLWAGVRRRSLSIGGLASGTFILFSQCDSAVRTDQRLVLICITISFVLSSLYVASWLRLVTTLGSGPAEAIELSFAIVLVVLGLLYVSGMLWITSVTLFAGTVAAVAIWGVLRSYRVR